MPEKNFTTLEKAVEIVNNVDNFFYREKITYCGKKYIEVDIYPCWGKQLKTAKVKGKRKRKAVTAPAQRNLNDKRARRYFTQLANTNFGENDIHLTCTYNKKYLPESLENAEQITNNFFRRINYRLKKRGLPPLKYLVVDEQKKNGRIHHHIIMSCGLSRDEIESLWSKKVPGGKIESFGYINADRLQPDENGISALCEYLTKDPKGRKRWSASQKLTKPEYAEDDRKYKKRNIEKIIKDDVGREFWEEKYKNFLLSENDYSYKKEFNEINGCWYIRLFMRRRD